MSCDLFALDLHMSSNQCSSYFSKDLRFCTRVSMPAQLLQRPTVKQITVVEKKEMQSLVDEAMRMRSENNKKRYDETILKMADLVVACVRPNGINDTRSLFSLCAPLEPFATRSQETVEQQYAWLDPELLRAACEKTVDVSPGSVNPN